MMYACVWLRLCLLKETDCEHQDLSAVEQVLEICSGVELFGSSPAHSRDAHRMHAIR